MTTESPATTQPPTGSDQVWSTVASKVIDVCPPAPSVGSVFQVRRVWPGPGVSIESGTTLALPTT